MKILVQLDKNNEIVSYCLVGEIETEYPKDYICVELNEKYISKVEENCYEVNSIFKQNYKKFRIIENELILEEIID